MKKFFVLFLLASSLAFAQNSMISIPQIFTGGDRTLLESAEQEAYETEHHFHNKEIWFGRKAVPTATSFADTTLYFYTVTAGSDSLFGTPVQILGSADTPWQAGRTKYDLHEIFVQTSSENTPFRIRFVYSATTYAAGRAADQTFGTMFAQDDTNPQTAIGTPITIMCPRIPTGYNLWVEAKNVTDSANFTCFFGIHEYIR